MILNELFLLSETPIGSIDFYGSQDPASMRADDIGIVTNPKSKLKIKRVLDKAPIMINLAFINHPYEYEGELAAPNREIKKPTGYTNPRMPKTMNYPGSGRMTSRQVKEIFDIEIKPDPNALTVLFGFNEGAERMPLTPWIIAHRIGHALHEIPRTREGGPFSSLLQTGNDITVDMAWDDANIMGVSIVDIFRAIGTTKTARDNKIVRSGEIINELFAQYLIKGEIIFKPLPMRFQYDRKNAKTGELTTGEVLLKDETVRKTLQMKIDNWKQLCEKTFYQTLIREKGQIVVF